MRRLLLLPLACFLILPITLLAQADRKEIVINAADLAPAEQRADKPTPGKWWLKRDAQDWGAPNGTILMTGETTDKPSKPGEWQVPPAERFVPYRVPALVVDPKVKGWHRIYVGVYNGGPDLYVRARVLGKLSDEPYPEYLQAPDRSKNRVVEVYWKPADLTGKQIHFLQEKAPMPHPGFGYPGGITHVRLVPMTDAEVAAARQEIELPPSKQQLFGMLDYTDEVFWWGTIESEDDVRAIVYRHKQAGFGRVYWRAFGSHLDNSLAVPDAAPRWSEADDKAWCAGHQCKAGWLAYMDLTKKYDPLKVAVEYGKKTDCDVHAWVRFTNFNRGPFANFWHDHPEFAVQMIATQNDPKTGKTVAIKPYKRSPYRRVLSFAYPEVRAFYVSFFKQLASTGTRGILIDLLRHPPIAGYEPIVSEAFKKKYGKDMEEFELFHDPLVQEFLSEYLRLFLVDLRKAIGKDVKICVRSSGPDKYALRGKEWIADGLIDAIMDGHWYSGNGPRATIDATVAAVGDRGEALAIAETLDVDPNKGWARREGNLSTEAITALAKHYSGRGVSHFGIYESTVFTWDPELRRAIRLAGWNYDPGKRGK
jgi:hypothetical protein